MSFHLSEATAVLERTPRALSAMLRDLPDAWIRCTEGPDTWSPYDIVGHLIHGERTDWIARAEIILAQKTNTTFTPFDRFAQLRRDHNIPIGVLLDEFAQLRAANLVTLLSRNLTDDHLTLRGRHPELGDVTLRQLLAAWVAHDLGHIVQISRTMAKQYRDEVGPWSAYLSVINS